MSFEVSPERTRHPCLLQKMSCVEMNVAPKFAAIFLSSLSNLIQERLWWLWPSWNRPEDDDSLNADPLEKLQPFSEPFDMFVSGPKGPDHNYVRFEAGKLLFCCDQLFLAIFDLR